MEFWPKDKGSPESYLGSAPLFSLKSLKALYLQWQWQVGKGIISFQWVCIWNSNASFPCNLTESRAWSEEREESSSCPQTQTPLSKFHYPISTTLRIWGQSLEHSSKCVIGKKGRKSESKARLWAMEARETEKRYLCIWPSNHTGSYTLVLEPVLILATPALGKDLESRWEEDGDLLPL